MELVINILMAECIILKFIPGFLGGLHKHMSYRDHIWKLAVPVCNSHVAFWRRKQHSECLAYRSTTGAVTSWGSGIVF